jgi:hypothetical protein
VIIRFEMDKNFEKTIADLAAEGANIKRAVNAGLAKGVKLAAARAATLHLSGQDLRTRSGNLKRAVDGWMEADFDGVVGVRDQSAVEKYKWLLGSETKTITPKKGRFLAIPIGEALTPSGVARFEGPRDEAIKAKYRSAFFFKSSSGNLIFGAKMGKTKRAKIYPLFVLKPSVTVSAKGSLAAAVLASADEITDAITQELAG